MKDTHAPFQIKGGTPWEIQFGRGSGWHGLDTLKITEDGKVSLHRLVQKRERRRVDGRQQTVIVHSWETAKMTLPPKARDAVLRAVADNRLSHLNREYHADVLDGTQWVLCLKQGSKEKSVYFNNHFPDAILRFAEVVDEVLFQNGLRQVRWDAVPIDQSRQHEKALWGSIK